MRIRKIALKCQLRYLSKLSKVHEENILLSVRMCVRKITMIEPFFDCSMLYSHPYLLQRRERARNRGYYIGYRGRKHSLTARGHCVLLFGPFISVLWPRMAEGCGLI